MKTFPLTSVFFAASLLLPLLGGDTSDCSAAVSALKSVAARAGMARAESAPAKAPPALAPETARPPAAAAPRAEAPRPARRDRPAHRFM
ncbi:MAG: hypothetical protein NTV51_07650 [Verrucomicrobia bacterium]|nr:hypothetical protein [Verrucomicrobiota bacterium]